MNEPQVLIQIERFDPEVSSWLDLDQLLMQLFSSPPSRKAVEALFALLERFPLEDGAGVLWTVVHGLEDLPAYEEELVASVQRRPSYLPLVMLRRLINSGQSHVGGVDFIGLLREVACRDGVEPELRETAAELAS
jgi:hypothetical protein